MVEGRNAGKPFGKCSIEQLHLRHKCHATFTSTWQRMRSNIDKTVKFNLKLNLVVISYRALFSNNRVMKDAKEKEVHCFHVSQDPIETIGADQGSYVN